MLSKNPLMNIAVPGLAALLALAVTMGANDRNAGGAVSADGPTPYSADHARVQANDAEQPATF